MLRYFKKKDGSESQPSPNVIETSNSKNTQSKDQCGDSNVRDKEKSSSKYRKIDLDTLPADPGERKKIDEFHPSVRDEIRRAYLQKGPCQPRNHSFQERIIGGRSRRFNAIWFDSYKYWLEYSVTEESAFCLCCYLFKPEIKNQGGHDSFVSGGFKAWNKKNRLDEHNSGSAHNLAVQKCQNLMKQAQSIASVLDRQTNISRKEYRILLEASIDCVRFCLHQGLPFRGHDEHEDSSNKGNFLELLSFYAEKVDEVGNVVLNNAPRNSQMTSQKIQKDIVHAIATETRKAIIKDLGDDLFGILVDESRDVSCKEQMALVLRYVNDKGCVVERFIGIAHVSDTLAASLKDAIVSMLSEYGLSPCRIRGQGYDGASNMRCQFNGLKTLIMRDTPSAYYIHCFAHQLQLALVFVAKNHFDIDDFFDWVSRLLNMIGASCKRRDNLREKQAQKVAESLVNHEIDTGRGLNQERSIKRPSDTRWGSHYGSLLNIMSMYSSIIEVLEDIENDGTMQEKRAEAHRLLGMIESFDFSICLHLMVKILGITNDLNFSLQKKDQEIVNAMLLVRVAKDKLQDMRDNE